MNNWLIYCFIYLKEPLYAKQILNERFLFNTYILQTLISITYLNHSLVFWLFQK